MNRTKNRKSTAQAAWKNRNQKTVWAHIALASGLRRGLLKRRWRGFVGAECESIELNNLPEYLGGDI